MSGRLTAGSRTAGCACSWSTTTTSSTGASACCSASSRGSSGASRRAPAPRRSSWPRRYKPHVALVDLFLAGESGADVCDVDPRGLAVDARAADLRRRADVAGGGARRRRLGVRLQGLGGARGRRGGADGRARDDDVPAEGRAAGAAADRARARGARPDRGRLDQPRDRRAAVPVSAHGQGAHERAVPQAQARNRAEAVQRAQRIGLLG